MGFERSTKFGAVGFQHGDVVLNRQGVVDLATKALGSNAGANAFACGVHRGCGACRATTDDEHVIGRLGAELGGVAGGRALVELGDDFFERHVARAKHGAVQEHHGNRHDFAVGHFLLERATFNDRGFDLGVDDGHERQRLHHVGAVVARQAHVHIKLIGTIERFDLLNDLLLNLGRVATGPQKRQHQRGELVP